MQAGNYDVIVAGAGPAGLAVALALSDAFKGELTVSVVDPALGAAAGVDDVRASALGAGSRRLLERLGVWTVLAPQAQHVARIEITDSRLSDGVRPVLLGYEPRLETGEPAMTILANAHLTAAMRATAATAKGVHLVAGAVVTATRDAQGARVALTDGRVLTTPLLVAADGRRSPLREAAGIKTVGWSHSQLGIVATIAHELPHEACAVQHFLPGGPFAILPLPGQCACVTWSEEESEARRLLAAPDAAFAAAIDRRVGGRLGRLTVEGPRGQWPLHTFLARGLIAERLALIGDAVRGVHPIAGQGLNLGFRDAAALAEVIADGARAGQDVGSLAVLERYEQWRRADGAMSAAGFDALNRLFSNDIAVLRALRDVGLGLVDRLPGLKHQLVAEAAGLTGEVPRLLQGQSA